jgi:hypothetical protein
MPTTLTKDQRSALEKLTLKAREAAETAARSALENLAVHEASYRTHMDVSFRQACMKFRSRPDSVGVSFLVNRRPYDVTVPPPGRCRSGAGRRGLGRLAQHEARAHAGPGSVLVASG